MKHPLISIVIATLNSDNTLPLVLESIKRQNYPKNRLEIIAVDGGSTDKTLGVVRKYGGRIIHNPQVDQVFAKQIGYIEAKGDLLLFLDSDEVIENHNSIKLKCNVITGNRKVKAVISSGYKVPKSYPNVNYYINEYGDPFSYFMYKSSRDSNWFIPQLLRNYPKVSEDNNRVIFNFSDLQDLPFIELTSMGVLIDLKYVKKAFPRILTIAPLHTHLFYLLNLKKNLFAVVKGDSIIHYSCPSLWAYLKKIRSRVKSNIFGTSMGFAGFTGRANYYPKRYQVKKFLFVAYTLSIFLPLLDSVYLAALKKRPIYLIHSLLCGYTLFLMGFYLLLKNLGVKPKLYGYGN